MNDELPAKQRHISEGARVEYAALRKEIVARIPLRQQIIAGTLTLGGLFLGVGLNWPPVSLIYPPLAAFLAFSWAQNDYRIRDIAGYIREIEPRIPVHWESYLRERPREFGSLRLLIIAHGGLFLFTQILAIYLGVLWLLVAQVRPSLRELIVGWTLVAADLLSVGLVVWILDKAKR